MHQSVYWTLVLFAFGCLPLQVAAEGPPTKQQPAETPAWRRHSDKAVRAYKLRIPQSKEKPKLTPKPVFIHNFNGHLESHAFVYLWTTKVNRPVAAVTSIVMRYDQDVDQWTQIDEFHSLHDASLVVERAGKTLWTPQGAGLDWKEIPKAPKPATSERLQGLQASQLARRFSLTAVYRKEDSRSWELRLIPKPVNTYSTKVGQQIVTGYLHFFCRATDPEAMLSLEVRRSAKGDFRWHYAPANYSDAGTYLKLDGKQVWKDDPPRFGSRNRHFGYQPNAKDFSIGTKTSE